MSLLERIKYPVGTLRNYVVYPAIGSLPAAWQVKVFERLTNSWPKGLQTRFDIEQSASCLSPVITQGQLEKQLGFEAAVKNTARSAAIEGYVGASLSIGGLYLVMLALFPDASANAANPVFTRSFVTGILGVLAGAAAVGDAQYRRYWASHGHEPSMACAGIGMALSDFYHEIRSEMRTSFPFARK